MRNFLLVLVLLLLGANSRAAEFIVTSNADSGPGTLREAIGLTSANGTASMDFIRFNLQVPVIELLSSLPALSTNLQVDGSNQGVKLGISDAGVSIIKAGSLPANAHIDIFSGDGLQIVQIYSIHFPKLEDGKLTAVPINFTNSSSITVGGPGKGNVFGAVDADVKMLGCQQVRILSNWFGLKTDKTQDDLVPFNNSLLLYGCSNIAIGGTASEEGNVFSGRYYGPRIVGSNQSTGQAGAPTVVMGELCMIRNNIFGLEGNQARPGFTAPPVISHQRNVFLLNNTSNLSAGFDLSIIPGTLIVQGNKLGLTGSLTRHLNLLDINEVIIGGIQAGEENTFINASASGSVYAISCGDVTILGNNIYCLENGVVYYSERSKVPIPVIKINSAQNGIIRGTATPNADIEIFSDGPCNKCEAGALSSKTRSDAQGNWQSTLPSGNGFTASATLNKRTSEFAMVGNDITRAYTINPSCGKSNGAIKGIIILNGTSTRWMNSRGEVVGTSLDLENVPAGTYTLTSFMGACQAKAVTYVLKDSGLDLGTDKAVINNTSCGQDNGGINGITLTNNGTLIRSIEWRNQKNEIKGTALELTQAAPGTYMIVITTENNCIVTAGPYIILASEPVIDRSVEKVVDGKCGDFTGSIMGPGISAGRPPYFYQWKDGSGKLLGTTQFLQNLSPGRYTLSMGDASDCGGQTFAYEVKGGGGALPPPKVNDVMICVAGTAVIRVNNPGQGTYVLYDGDGAELMRDPEGVFVVTVNTSAVFFVENRTGSCTSNKVTVSVTISNDGPTKINTITPNGDGINDVWALPAIANYPEARIQVYNRYGQSIYQSIGYRSPFDGKRNGRDLPSGTYFYIIDLKKGCSILKGAITILR